MASCPKRLWRVVQGIVAGCPGYCGGMSRVLWRVVLGRVVFVASCLGFYVIHVETQRFSKTTKKWHFEDSKYPVPVYTAHPRFLIFADGKKVRRIHGDLRYPDPG